MSTLRSLPFVLDTSIFHTGRPHFATLHWKFCSSFGQKNFFNKDLNGERFDGFSLKKETSISHDWHTFKSKGLRATRKVAVGEGGNSDDTEDTVKSTIKKTKRVFAMQKNLLQETDEKKKRNSSRRKGNLNTELDVSYEEGEEYMSNMQKASNNTLLDRKYTNGISAVTYTSFTATNISETRDDEIERDFDKYNQELEENFSSKVKALDLITETNSTTTKPKRAPSFSTEIIETNGSTSKLIEEQIETNIDGFISELDLMQKEEVKPPPLAGANAMNIILVTAECAPWSKTGGLVMSQDLYQRLWQGRGHRVMVVTPRYGNYSEPKETGILKLYNVGGQDIEVTYYQAYIDGVDFVFIDSHVFWHRDDDIYGGDRREILKRMALFCKAAVEIPWHVPCGGICYGDGNLVFIANDWHTALLPVYLKAYYRDNGLMIYTRSVLVIHNIAHQGRGPLHDFNFMGLPEHYRELFKLYDPVGGEHCNIFAAGIKTADRIVTVSHGYAWEIKTIEGGWGLHGIISENDWKLRGIVNGIDMNEWNPQVDFYLNSDGYTNYSIQTFKTGKAQCKTALQRELGLPVRDNVPLLGFIGRLDGQKGVDLIFEAIPWMLGQDVQLIMLGTGRPDLEEMLKRFDAQNRDKIRSWVGFSVKMAHRITAGVDILLMPSRFEPCGLNQLYAMIYGTIPVVHAVGGLRDTVQPFDPYNDSGFGWTFDRAEHIKLIHALGNCLHTYRQFQSAWERLQIRGMSQDISWDRVSQNYEEVLVEAKYQW